MSFQKRRQCDDQQKNHEVWGLELVPNVISREMIESVGPGDGPVVRIHAVLTSALRESKPVPIFFDVRLDESRLWVPTDGDRQNSKPSVSQTRVYVDTSTLPGIVFEKPPLGDDRIVHIGTILWRDPRSD